MHKAIVLDVFFHWSKLLIIIKHMHWIIAVNHSNKDFCVLNFCNFLNNSMIFFEFFSIVVSKLISVQTTMLTSCSRIFTLSSILMCWKNSWSFILRISFILILWKYKQNVLITASCSVSLFILLSLTLIILWSIQCSNSWSCFEDWQMTWELRSL